LLAEKPNAPERSKSSPWALLLTGKGGMGYPCPYASTIACMIEFDAQRHHRRSIRLKAYDYAQEGAYFVTIVARHREFLFGEIINGEMRLGRYGEIVQKWWKAIPRHFPNVEIGAFVIMPNHIHGIILIIDERRGTVSVSNDDVYPQAQGGRTPPLRMPTLRQIIAYFKYQSTKEMNVLNNTGTVTKFWQRNYYEHIIRNKTDLQNKTAYIEANRLLWAQDNENPINAK
jgi:REP element-mobilizing transposase RayT